MDERDLIAYEGRAVILKYLVGTDRGIVIKGRCYKTHFEQLKDGKVILEPVNVQHLEGIELLNGAASLAESKSLEALSNGESNFHLQSHINIRSKQDTALIFGD